MTRLHFTIGPVQSFVGKSRRTRDLWASSFLLSYLAGKAIEAAVEKADARPVLPAVENNALFRALGGNTADAPRHGSIPNRFVVEVADEDAAVRAAGVAEKAFRDAWKKISKQVWVDYVDPVQSQGKGTKEIWDRQIEKFWAVYWAVSEEPGALDLRKNWRTHVMPDEPGGKCTMMHRWQELSGYIRAQNRKAQDDFWEAVREGCGTLDLAPDERLCAVGLIKRLYPKLTKKTDIIGWGLDTKNWPSTAYLSAIPWLQKVAEEEPEFAREYAGKVTGACDDAEGERNTQIPSLVRAARENDVGDFLNLDGNFFFDTAIENDRATPLDEEEQRDVLIRELVKRKSQPGVEEKGLYERCGRPSPFYAAVLMDGDSLGGLLRRANDQGQTSEVSGALGEFTQRVDEIVERHDGVAVYAGGDDVMALMSLPDALPCATELRGAYEDVFDDVSEDLSEPGKPFEATISGAIAYAHYKTPLTDVFDEAHHLLDDVAKDKTGRDSLAVGVLKSSGKQSEWSMPWDEALAVTGETIIEQLVDRYENDEYSSSFIYRLRELFMLWSDSPRWEPGQFIDTVDDLEPKALYRAEYRTDREREIDEASAEEAVEALLAASRRVRRNKNGESKIDDGAISFDAPLLMRFLAQQRSFEDEREQE